MESADAEGLDRSFYLALGEAVLEVREERGMSRKQLAERAQLSYPYVAEIENGRKRLSARALLYVSRALGVKPFELLERAEAEVRAAPRSERDAAARADLVQMIGNLPAKDLPIASALISRLSGG